LRIFGRGALGHAVEATGRQPVAVPAGATGAARRGGAAPGLSLRPRAQARHDHACRFLPCAIPAEGLARIKGPRHAADTANEAPPRSPMDSRLLIRMAAPLVLTLLTPIAVGFDW